MTNDAIIKQIEAKLNKGKPVDIHFKQRNTIRGLFIKGYDYEDLRSKNFWRVVTNANIELWGKTKDIILPVFSMVSSLRDYLKWANLSHLKKIIMFIQTWSKYLPVIRILLKRSAKEQQTLDMNKSDFQRATGGKKVKFIFSVTLVNGRPREIENISPLAKDLISVLQQ